MPVFEVRGEFWADGIDDALDFLARYFRNVIDDVYTEAGALFIEVKPKVTDDD